MRPSLKTTLGLLKQTAASWIADYAPSMGAALAYYTLFSIAPLLLIVIGIAGLVFGEDAARGAIFDQLSGFVGADGAKAVQDLLQAADRPRQGMVATVVGAATLLLGAMTVFGELQNALDRIWRAPARARAKGWWTILRTRVLSFGMVLGIAFLLTVSLVLSAALAALGKWWAPALAGWEIVAHLLDLALSFALITLMFALVYRYLPRVHVAWHDVWIGAAVTSLLFAIGKLAIGLYLGKSTVASAFGAAGSLVVLILWVYYSAQIFLFGAEFTWVYAHELGSRRGQPRPRPASAVASQDTEGRPEKVAHQRYPRPALSGVRPAKPTSLRRHHPFGSLGIAFVAGIALGTARLLAAGHAPAFRALRRRFT